MKKMLVVLAVLLSVAIVSFCLTGCVRKKTEEIPTAEMQSQSMDQQAQLNSEALTAKALPAVPAAEPQAVTAPQTAQPVVTEASAVSNSSAEEIQTALKNAGYYSGAIDGKLGPKSQKAIEDFQRDNSLVVDGKVGAKTWIKLQAYLVAGPEQKTGD